MKKGAKFHLGKNFLVRTSPQFVQQGMAVAIADAPSDQPNGMSVGFRNSPEHVQDIRKVIDFLDTQGLKPHLSCRHQYADPIRGLSGDGVAG